MPAYELFVWGVYLAGVFAHALSVTLLCVAFGLVNILLGLA